MCLLWRLFLNLLYLWSDQEKVDTAWLFPGLPGAVVGGAIQQFVDLIETAIGDAEIDPAANRRYLAQTALGGYAASLMQPA